MSIFNLEIVGADNTFATNLSLRGSYGDIHKKYCLPQQFMYLPTALKFVIVVVLSSRCFFCVDECSEVEKRG
jgi:hypothetical protein